MGQAHSTNRNSASSTAPLNVFNPPPNTSQDGTLESAYTIFYADGEAGENYLDSGITQPAAPRQLCRLSELIDPKELIASSREDLALYSSQHPPSSDVYKNKRLPKIVQSPSGTTLGAHEFMARQDRPLAIRERQESIKMAIEKAERAERIRMAMEAELAEQERQRKGSLGSIYTKIRQGSSDSGKFGPFEKSRIEEGRKAQREKRGVMKAEKASKSRFGCFNCFGSDDFDE